MRDRVGDRRFIEVSFDGGDTLVWSRGPVAASTSAVLFLHDRATNGRVWDLVMRRLPPTTALIAPDLRGRGSAWRLPSSTGVDDHVADLVRLLDQLDIDHVLAVGHGMGARLASALAGRHPDRVALTVGVIGTGPDPFHPVLGMAFTDRLEHRGYWRQHPLLAGLDDDEGVDGFVGHGIAGPDDHHRWRVDLASLIADDASGHDVLASTDLAVARPHTRSIVVGPVVPTASAGLGTITHLPDSDFATVLLRPAGADAVAAQVVSLLAPVPGR